jgi:hypothetical protein
MYGDDDYHYDDYDYDYDYTSILDIVAAVVVR